MRIPCPYCGERSVDEFLTIGTADPLRPAADQPFEAWHDYLYLRDNPAGEDREWFYHQAGCRAWLKVVRNTLTHQMIRAEPASAEGVE